MLPSILFQLALGLIAGRASAANLTAVLTANKDQLSTLNGKLTSDPKGESQQ